jgi:hypothetical protein
MQGFLDWTKNSPDSHPAGCVRTAKIPGNPYKLPEAAIDTSSQAYEIVASAVRKR